MRIRTDLALAALLLGIFAQTASATSFVAFSLRQAARQLASESHNASDLGGMTDPIAFVYDAEHDDYLLVGVADPAKSPLALSEFVSALRAILSHKELPEVSIDPAPPGADPHQQPVRFRGSLEDTALGADLLDADITLKKVALGLIRTDIWGVHSYLAMSVGEAENGIQLSEIGSRFWLRAGDTSVSGSDRDGVMVVNSCKVRVETEVYTSASGERDPIGDRFSNQLAASFPELAMQFPAFGRVIPIFRLVALTQGMARQSSTGSLAFWLSQYQLQRKETPRTYALTQARQDVASTGGTVVLSGGIDTNPLLIRLNAGDATALREVVLHSRPSPTALVWYPPLDRWNYTGEDAVVASASGASSNDGMNVRLQYLQRNGMPLPAPTPQTPRQPSAPQLPTPQPPKLQASLNSPSMRTQTPSPPPVSNTRPYTPPHFSSNVGGVMLQATASIIGGSAALDITSKNFALVMDGENVRPSEGIFRKFVTALWAVYFSDQDPGISIDPISEDADKHLVRYIGNVVNTDLGRVMREADYLMKKWAVGTERATIPGFKNPDDFMAKVGLQANAWSRFWFVPEDMTFKRAGDTLLFSGGRMTVKTEYMSQGIATHAEPANERFAELFTSQYNSIAASYPVYQELFEYAKLVSLAKYLKTSGVPLTWFLLANKDLVLTEDSPGTVDALAHGSNYYRNLTIKGGVDLKTEGRYVYDASALAAIQTAMAQITSPGANRSTLASTPAISPFASQPFSFDVGKSSYSVVPQYSLATGRDRWGNRYQTDMALRNGSKPGLELVRYYDGRESAPTEFGHGWRFLVPYRIRHVDEETRNFLDVPIRVKMAIENLLTGQREVLTFSTDRYTIAGYVPDKLSKSQVVGLFITVNGSFRLVDKLGNEFWFDPSGTMTDCFFANQERTHYQYLTEASDAFDYAPYEIKPDGPETIEYRGEVLPKRIIVRDANSGQGETLMFDLTQDVATYFPENEATSRYRRLRWTTNSGYRLDDKYGNLAGFKSSGQFEAFLPNLDSNLIRSVSMGNQKIEMTYRLNADGRIVIAKSTLTNGQQGPELAVRYDYNPDGTLAGTDRVQPKKRLAMDPLGTFRGNKSGGGQ